MIFLGSAGTAKTYFLAACAKHFITRYGWFMSDREDSSAFPPNIRKVTEKQYLDCLKREMDDDAGSDVRNGCREADFLLIDELGKGMGTDWQSEQIFDLIDERYSSMLPTIIAGNYTRKQMQSHYGPRYGMYLCSRLFDKSNCVIEEWTNYDIRDVEA